jgi:hypothetical protein
MNTDIVDITTIEELESRLAPQSDASFLDRPQGIA